MTEDQRISIRRRNPGNDTSENWFRIFGILFPGETPPDSPCMHFGYTLSPSETNLHIDLGDDSLQNEVNDVARRFRQQAPGMLNDEIRSRLTSEMDFNFREEYLLDLILHEAVSSVVQHLTTNCNASRGEQAAQPTPTVSEPDGHLGPRFRSDLVPDPVIEHTEALQPLIGIRAFRSQDPELSETGDPQHACRSPNQSEAQMQRGSSQNLLEGSGANIGVEPFPNLGNFCG
jgi:hypothetical protein